MIYLANSFTKLYYSTMIAPIYNIRDCRLW